MAFSKKTQWILSRFPLKLKDDAQGKNEDQNQQNEVNWTDDKAKEIDDQINERTLGSLLDVNLEELVFTDQDSLDLAYDDYTT